ncbi:MAG: cph15 [Fibrobacteres bacterium]|nr:cph15 [Fibrobacterota bacterium]
MSTIPETVDEEVDAGRTSLEDSERTRRALLGMLEDLHLAEASHRDSLERFEIISRATNDVVWDWDLNTDSVRWNANFTSLFGYPREEIEPGSESWSQRVHPEDYQRVLDGIHSVIGGTGQSWSDEYRFRRRDGSYADILDRGFVLRDAAGRGVRMIGAMQDISARKQAEQEISRIFALSPDMICSADLQGRFFRLNRQFERVLGYTVDELRRVPFMDHIHPDDLESSRLEMQLLQAGNTAIGFVNRWRAKDGSYRWLEWNVMAIPDEDRIYAVARDITERKANEDALRASEERYRLVVEGSAAGIWDWNPGQGKITFSPRVAEMFGLPLRDLPTSREAFEAFIHPEDRRTVNEALKAYLDRHAPYYAEYRLRMASGEYRWMSAQGKAQWDDNGNLVRMAGSLVDIHERKVAENALVLTLDLLRRTSDIAKVGGWELDLITGKPHFSEEHRKIMEIDPRATLTLEAVMEYVAPEARPEVEAHIDAAIHQGKSWKIEFPVKTAKGRDLWILSHGEAVMKDGKAVRVVGVVQDISERKRAEDDLHRLNAELEKRVAARTAELAEKNRELEAFSYSVSHDLKAPLRGIDGYSQLLRMDYSEKLDEDGRGFLDNIRAGVAHMQALIDDMLAYSRMERRALAIAPQDVPKAVEGILADLNPDPERIDLSLDLVPGAVLADKEGLAIALRNLIDNAVKFSGTRRPSVIGIRSRIDGDRYILSVRDNGTGFDMKHYENIFKMFHRLHRSEEFPGTGVGLAMVRKAMDRMGGRVWAESAPGQGAEFHLDLPLAVPATLPGP